MAMYGMLRVKDEAVLGLVDVGAPGVPGAPAPPGGPAVVLVLLGHCSIWPIGVILVVAIKTCSSSQAGALSLPCLVVQEYAAPVALKVFVPQLHTHVLISGSITAMASAVILTAESAKAAMRAPDFSGLKLAHLGSLGTDASVHVEQVFLANDSALAETAKVIATATNASREDFILSGVNLGWVVVGYGR